MMDDRRLSQAVDHFHRDELRDESEDVEVGVDGKVVRRTAGIVSTVFLQCSNERSRTIPSALITVSTSGPCLSSHTEHATRMAIISKALVHLRTEDASR